MAQESDIAFGIMQIAASRPNGLCTYKQAYQQIPGVVRLSAANLAPSQTRQGEPMWHQLVRNIQSHHATVGNFIQLGYLQHVRGVGFKITPLGMSMLTKKP